ncbi:chaperone protein DnaK [Arthrobacter sp. Hiyo8]|nr:chaperone protein DnaK [Arthrobacter sp. Hiyo8]
MTITGGTALSKEDIDRMVREAEEHAAEDKAAAKLPTPATLPSSSPTP